MALLCIFSLFVLVIQLNRGGASVQMDLSLRSCIDTFVGADIRRDLPYDAADVITAVIGAPDGNVFVSVGSTVVLLTADGPLSVTSTGANGVASGASSALDRPGALARDAAGNIYVAELGKHRVVKINRDGTTSVVAGTGDRGYSSVSGLATDSDFDFLAAVNDNFGGLAVDPRDGSLLVSDIANHQVKKVWPNGTLSTIAGTGQPTSGDRSDIGDGGLAIHATLNEPSGLAVDADGNILLADSLNDAVRKISADTGVITTVIGQYPVIAPTVVSVDYQSGTFVVFAGMDVYEVRPDRTFTTATAPFGSVSVMRTPQGRTLTATKTEITIEPEGTVLPLFNAPVDRSVSSVPWTISLGDPGAVATDRDGTLYVGDTFYLLGERAYATSIKKVLINGTTTSLNLKSAHGHTVGPPVHMVVDEFSPSSRANAHKFGPDLIVAVELKGRVGWGFFRLVQNGGIGDTNTLYVLSNSSIVQLGGMAIDNQRGLLYFTDSAKHVVWRWCIGAPSASLFVGNTSSIGQWGYAGDGGNRTLALMTGPAGLALDSVGNVLIADSANLAIRRVNISDDTITTIIRSPSDSLSALATDPYDNVFAVDRNNHKVMVGYDTLRSRNASFIVFAGTGNPGFSGEGGRADAADLNDPVAITVDKRGTIFIADNVNFVVRSAVLGTPTAPHCPTGHFCSCARRWQTCTNASTFCPANSAAPVPVARGFTVVAAVNNGGERVFVSQRPCPASSFCVDGTDYPCPGGSFGLQEYNWDVTQCGSCPAGTYLAEQGVTPAYDVASFAASGVIGQVNVFSSVCTACPRGTSRSSSRSAFCSFCPQGSFEFNGSCVACGPSSFSLFGSSSCFDVNLDNDILQHADGVVRFFRTEFLDSGDWDTTQLNHLIISVAAVIMAVSVVPLLVLLLRPKSKFSVWLTSVDGLDLEHPVPEGGHPTSKPTAAGGGFTIFSYGALAASIAAVSFQFAYSNVALNQTLWPALPNTIKSYGEYNPKTSSFILPGLHDTVLTEGIIITISTMGRSCTQADASVSNLLLGLFNQSAIVDSDTYAVTHSFVCLDCLVDENTMLEVSLPGSCTTFSITAAAVGAWGSISVTSVAFENVSSITATVDVSMEVLEDLVTGTRNDRGYELSSFRDVAADDAPLFRGPTTKIKLQLPLYPTFTLATLEPIMTTITFLSGLVGLLGVTSVGQWGFGLYHKASHLRKRGAGHGHGNGHGGDTDRKLASHVDDSHEPSTKHHHNEAAANFFGLKDGDEDAEAVLNPIQPRRRTPFTVAGSVVHVPIPAQTRALAVAIASGQPSPAATGGHGPLSSRTNSSSSVSSSSSDRGGFSSSPLAFHVDVVPATHPKHGHGHGLAVLSSQPPQGSIHEPVWSPSWRNATLKRMPSWQKASTPTAASS